MPARSISATSFSNGTGRSRDQLDCTPPSGASGWRAVSVEMTWGWMSIVVVMTPPEPVAQAPGSLPSHAGLVDDRRPLVDVGFHAGLHLLRSRAAPHDADLPGLRLYVRARHHLIDLVVEPLDDPVRQTGRSGYSVPTRHLVIEPAFPHRRHIGQPFRARRTGGREHPELAVLDRPLQGRVIVERDIDVAA